MPRLAIPLRYGALALLGLAVWTGTSWAETAAPPQILKECDMDAVHQSACIYELILDDLKANHSDLGGGGISSIVQKSTTSFIASIAQEGRVDLFTYEISIEAGGAVSIANKTIGVKSY